MAAFKPANGDRIVTDDPALLELFPATVASLPTLPPKLRGNTYLLEGQIREFTKSTEPIASIIATKDGHEMAFSSFARCDKNIAIEALDSSVKAFDKGRGVWPRMSMKERAACMSAFLEDFKLLKEELVSALMWDICKSREAATDEVDRTIGALYSPPVLDLV